MSSAVCPKCKVRVIPKGAAKLCPGCDTATVEPFAGLERLNELAKTGALTDPKSQHQAAAKARWHAYIIAGALTQRMVLGGHTLNESCRHALRKPQISRHILEFRETAAAVSKADDGITAAHPLHCVHAATIEPRDVPVAFRTALDLADDGEHWAMRVSDLSIAISAGRPV